MRRGPGAEDDGKNREGHATERRPKARGAACVRRGGGYCGALSKNRDLWRGAVARLRKAGDRVQLVHKLVDAI